MPRYRAGGPRACLDGWPWPAVDATTCLPAVLDGIGSARRVAVDFPLATLRLVSEACVTEALGMSLTGCATPLAVSAERLRIAKATGERAVGLVKEDLKPRDILASNSFENAIMVDMALGGSTNTVLHVTAIANEAEIDLPLFLFDKLSKRIPHICSMIPSGPYDMKDLDEAGGIPAVMKQLSNALHLNSVTVTGKTVKEN